MAAYPLTVRPRDLGSDAVSTHTPRVGRFGHVRTPEDLQRIFARHVGSIAHAVLDNPEHAMTDAEAVRFVSLILHTVVDYDDAQARLVSEAMQRHPSGKGLGL